MTITRISGKSKGRSRAVVHDGLVYAVATDTTSATNIPDQTRQTLMALDKTLKDAGSDKSGLLQATIYLKDMATKAEMDVVWCEWIGSEKNWPQRACVGADLACNDMIEIVVTATVK